MDINWRRCLKSLRTSFSFSGFIIMCVFSFLVFFHYAFFINLIINSLKYWSLSYFFWLGCFTLIIILLNAIVFVYLSILNISTKILRSILIFNIVFSSKLGKSNKVFWRFRIDIILIGFSKIIVKWLWTVYYRIVSSMIMVFYFFI